MTDSVQGDTRQLTPLEEAQELAKWVMPAGENAGKQLACIRIGTLKYIVNMRRTRGANSRPVRTRKIVRETVERYLKALNTFRWEEVQICTECGTTIITGKVRGRKYPCNGCGNSEYAKYRRFKE